MAYDPVQTCALVAKTLRMRLQTHKNLGLKTNLTFKQSEIETLIEFADAAAALANYAAQLKDYVELLKRKLP